MGHKKSISSTLVDISESSFDTMLEEANMTVLLNIQQSLHIIYDHTLQVKKVLEEKGMTGSSDTEKAKETIKNLSVILELVKGRFNKVKETYLIRQNNTWSIYK